MDYQELLIKYMQVNHAEPMNGRDHMVLKQFCLWLNNNAAQHRVQADLPIVCDNCFVRRASGDLCENCGSPNTASR